MIILIGLIIVLMTVLRSYNDREMTVCYLVMLLSNATKFNLKLV